MIPRVFPGIPTWHAYAGQPVKAADVQAILDWLRWYIVYFCPDHTFFSWDDGNKGKLTSYAAYPAQPVYTSDYITFSGADAPGTISYTSGSISIPEGVYKVSQDARSATNSTSTQSGRGPVYVDSWVLPPDVITE